MTRAQIVLQVAPVEPTVAAKAEAWAQLYWLASPADCQLAMNRALGRALGLADDARLDARSEAQYVAGGRPSEQLAAACFEAYRELAAEQVTP